MNDITVLSPALRHQSERPALAAEALFRPRGVAVVGASRDPHKPGGAILRNLIAAKPASAVHAVNPHPLDVEGVQWWPRVLDLPQPCDLAIVAVPAAQVPATLTDLGARGVRVAVVVSAGLSRESGLLAAALAAARSSGMRLLGPNCIGVLVPRVRLDASFSAGGALPGRLAFLSQSGALVAAVLDWARQRSIGFSAIVSMGDMVDVGLDELVHLLAEDEQTTAILLYLESTLR